MTSLEPLRLTLNMLLIWSPKKIMMASVRATAGALLYKERHRVRHKSSLTALMPLKGKESPKLMEARRVIFKSSELSEQMDPIKVLVNKPSLKSLIRNLRTSRVLGILLIRSLRPLSGLRDFLAARLPSLAHISDQINLKGNCGGQVALQS